MPFIESIFWLALNLYHECRGEPLAGQIAVAHVVMNRAEKRGKSLREIVLQPYQFSVGPTAERGQRSPNMKPCASVSRLPCRPLASG